jgi:hypothetical protein
LRVGFHIVPDRGIEGDDPPLIGREHLHLHILIEVDGANGLLFDGKFARFDRLDLHSRELRIRKIKAERVIRTSPQQYLRHFLCIGICCWSAQLGSRSIIRLSKKVREYSDCRGSSCPYPNSMYYSREHHRKTFACAGLTNAELFLIVGRGLSVVHCKKLQLSL